MQAKAYKGIGMEGQVAKWYATNSRKDIGEFTALARRMASSLTEGASVLEVAPGPGYFAIELAKLGKFTITGLDISKTFVAIARKNAKEEAVNVDFRQGDVARMPFPDGSFDLVLCRAAFKNFSDPVGALTEMRRVLKPGGRAVVIDLSHDTPKAAIDSYVDKMDLSLASSIMTKLTFRWMLIPRAYTKEQFRKFIAESGFEKSDIHEQPLGFEITLVK